ncbi:sulfite exporter TauE/SafE family protein [Carboxylicivirga mesophila]|uniref:Probable membrane transporter protein n=1 Tax=Carboxylicivirga mesophila TaxID=1166478 RepID=A0ABS5KF24_9BACT|nr:sulfite exporter TauE/SafE family protein [Carboxylicivirga mesophila]MBS2213610.1 sulfite exporter TauE/SafE family protein [Carboxylicivirga mesophila]
MPNIWILLIVVASSLIKGITGFGFALISLPLLLFWYQPAEIIPVLMICNFIASMFIILQKKEHQLVNRQERLLIIAGGFFTIAGVILLKSINQQLLVHVTGVAFIIITLLSLKPQSKPLKKLSDLSYLAAGAVIGIITGSISVSGPPLALFLNKARVDKMAFREVFAWFSVVTASIAIIGYIPAGLLSLESLKQVAVFVPILLLGTVAGKRLNHLIPGNNFRLINIVITLLASLMLVIGQ